MTIEEFREKLEELDLQIIASVGTARSMYIEALNQAKEGRFEDAENTIAEAGKLFNEGNNAHYDILILQGQDVEIPFDLMLVHAED